MYLVRFFNGLRKETEHAFFANQADLDRWLDSVGGKFYWQGKLHAEDFQLYKLEGTIQVPEPVFPKATIQKTDPQS